MLYLYWWEEHLEVGWNWGFTGVWAGCWTEPSPHYFVPFDLFEDQEPIAEADEEEDQEPIAEAPQAAQAPAAAEAAAKAKAAALAAARARFNRKKQPSKVYTEVPFTLYELEIAVWPCTNGNVNDWLSGMVNMKTCTSSQSRTFHSSWSRLKNCASSSQKNLVERVTGKL